MVIQRGEIWWANLGMPEGSSPGYRRPVLVLQSNDFNRSRIATVIVAVITSNMHLAHAPGNVTLSKKASRLPRESVVNVSQVITVDKQFLEEKVSTMSLRVMKQVDAGLRLVLSL
jgi:mRNA interferase MazF